MLNIFDVEASSKIYGPGSRVVIWVQGCKLRCKGCWNTEMWSFETNQLISINDLYKFIVEQKEIEGITLIGGEPMHQSEELVKLCKKIQNIGLSVVLFTGYNIEEIQKDSGKELLSLSDIIIAGPYIEEERNIYIQWRGSENQIVIFNTDRYKGYEIDDANYCEIELNENGEVIISGFPEDGLFD